jgi:hypothetical protein
MYSSFCILMRLRSCSAGTPAGVFAFWGPPSPRRAVVEGPLVPVALGSPAVGCELPAWQPNGRYHNEQTVACDVSSLAATLTKKRGDPFVSLLLVPGPRVLGVSDYQLSALICQPGSLIGQCHSEQAVTCDVSSLAATLTKMWEGVQTEPTTRHTQIKSRRGSGLRDTQERPQPSCCQSFTS